MSEAERLRAAESVLAKVREEALPYVADTGSGVRRFAEHILEATEQYYQDDPYIIEDRLQAALDRIKAIHVPIRENGGMAVGCARCDWDEDGEWPCETLRVATLQEGTE